MNELPYIEKWLYQSLKTEIVDVANRVYGNRVPTGAVFPLVNFNFMAGRDVQGNGTKRIMTRPLYQIKAIVRGGMGTSASGIADQIDDVVQNTESVIFEGFIFSARREQQIAYSETGADPEQKFFHLGGLYRIDVQKA